MASPMGQLEYHRTITLPSKWLKVPYPTTSFAGQTIVITGSNTGVGLEAARHIVRLGATKVIIAVRNVAKGEEAAAEIIQSIKATSNAVEVWPVDLTKYKSIKAFAERVRKLDRVDAVMQNAGIASAKFNTTEAGEEMILGTNVIGSILLGLLVLPALRESAIKFNTRTRLIFTGSESFLFAQFNEANIPGSLLEALRDEKICRANLHDRYQTSKLLLLQAVREITARSPVSPDSNVIIAVTTPGVCWSGLYREVPWFFFPLYFLIMALFARRTETGGRMLVDALRPDLGTEAHGTFLLDGKPIEKLGPSVESERAQKVAKRFTNELFGKLEEISPGSTRVLD